VKANRWSGPVPLWYRAGRRLSPRTLPVAIAWPQACATPTKFLGGVPADDPQDLVAEIPQERQQRAQCRLVAGQLHDGVLPVGHDARGLAVPVIEEVHRRPRDGTFHAESVSVALSAHARTVTAIRVVTHHPLR
jgi:hypothetical protein